MRVFATFVAIPVFLVTSTASSQETVGGPQLTIVGEGEVQSAPNQAAVTMAVVTEEGTASEALQANNAAVARALEVLHAGGLASRDIQTSALSLKPRYTDRRGTEVAKIDGYTATNQVTFRTRQLGSLGALIDQLVMFGATEIRDLSFETSERNRLLLEAKRGAFLDARNKAEAYAAVAQARLGPVLVLVEENSVSHPMRTRLPESARAVPLEAGEVVVRARVRVTWRLEPGP